MPEIPLSLLEKISRIRLLILDVDGTLTDGGVYITDEGKQFKKFNVRDGMGIKMLLKAGIEVGFISHSFSSGMVKARADMLGVKYCYVGIKPKEEIFEEWRAQLKLNADQIAVAGDDINDIPIMKKAGLTICPADAVYQVRFYTDIVLTKKGGEGCIREWADEYFFQGNLPL